MAARADLTLDQIEDVRLAMDEGLAYIIEVVPDGTMVVSFKDYMWLQTEDRLFNKAYMSKWGFPLGEVSIMFEKQI